MIILSYILAFSLVILSVVKTTEIFIQSNKSLEKIESQFVDQTRRLIKKADNEKGNISLVAALMTVLLSFLLLFFVTKMKLNFQESLYRKDSYLCVKFLNTKTEKYISEMVHFNWLLRSAFIVVNSGMATVEAQGILKTLTIVRNLSHFNYLKKIGLNHYCQSHEVLSYIKNIPFKTQPTLALTTNLDQTVILRQNKWTLYYYKLPNGIRIKKSFCLKSSFLVESEFFPKTNYSTIEIPIEDLSSLKCSSGLSL